MPFDNFQNFDVEMIFRLLLGIALGASIGFERELKHRPAGLRTHVSLFGCMCFRGILTVF